MEDGHFRGGVSLSFLDKDRPLAATGEFLVVACPSPAIGMATCPFPSLSVYRSTDVLLGLLVANRMCSLWFLVMRFCASHAGVDRRKRVMKKNSKLGLVLKCLQIANALARLAKTVIALLNMTNNYPRQNADQMVFEI